MSDFDYKCAALRVSGDAELLAGEEYEHGDEVYVVGRVRVGEVAFPEKDGSVKRVHKSRLTKVVIVTDSEAAEAFMAKALSNKTGQSTIYDVMAGPDLLEKVTVPAEPNGLSADDLVDDDF